VSRSGTRYVGTFERGVENGRGRLEYSSGDSYEGEFRDGKLEGQGTYTLSSGSVFRGRFRDGDLNGPGTYTRWDGDEYVGEFVDNEFHGKGTLRFGDGGVYEGEFRRERFHGTGSLRKPDGSEYEGEFEDNRFNGLGTLRKANGATYSGAFDDGKFHGEGKYVTGNGGEFAGRFVEGTFTGRGTYRSGSYHYTGDFVDWDYHGEGTLVRPDGSEYTGQFEEDRYHGRGRYTSARGRVYVGEFAEGRYHGAGTLTWTDGSGAARVAHGEWEEGRYVRGDTDELLPLEPERLLYDQPERVTAALARVAESRPGVPDMYFVGFASWADQDVFMKEVRFAERIFSERLGADGRSVALVNHRMTLEEAPLATVTNLERVLRGVSERMESDEDVLFLLLTSHGSEDHEVAVDLEGLPLEQLDPERLAGMLESAGIRWKVVLVSACYSGGFVEALRGEDTLVITASAPNRKSFGCSDEAEFTSFGGAFLRDELATAPTFAEAFERARLRIHQLEEEQEREHSDPQLASAPSIEHKLAEWRASLRSADREKALPASIRPQ
jgi:hypothetical protein